MYDDIVKFAELENFMDQKLKNYSSGMQVRLAFSVAIQADADILLIDEVLAVGDEAFQRKCLAYFAKLKKDKKTVIFVTHSMDAVQKFCDRAILIDKGHKTEIGSPLKISQIYRELNDADSVTVGSDTSKSKYGRDVGTKYVKAEVDFKNYESELEFKVSVESKVLLEDPIIALELFKDDGQQVYRWVTDEKLDNLLELSPGKKNVIKFTLQNIFPSGVFSGRVLVRKRDRSIDYGIFNDIVKFEIKNKSKYPHDILWKPTERVMIESNE
jgi:ABC-2 type transport system ATP-binding protein